jgi:hypothetical protein
MSFYDFNTAEQINFETIPAGTLAKVNIKIKPGGHNDHERGWTDGYATKNWSSGAVYLSCEFTILEGEYAGRRIWQLIGLYSEKNDNIWGAMGRSFIRSILNSSKGLIDKDDSSLAQEARKISSFADIDGLEFVAKVGVEKDKWGDEINVIKKAVGPEHKAYDTVMGLVITDKPEWA